MGEMVAVGGAHENMKSVTDAMRVAPMLETIRLALRHLLAPARHLCGRGAGLRPP